jgi:K+-sensing histidine kinase KdpD
MDKSDKLTSFRFFVASLASLVVVGFFDYITGYELYMEVFYFIPVSICAWHLRRRDVLVVATLCALTWGGVDFYVGHPYSSRFFWYWNIFVNFSLFLILGLVVKSLRDNLRKQSLARQELEKTLAGLRQSAVEIEKLRSQLQIVCAWTKSIKVEDKWMTLEQFLHDHLRVKISHGISPEALKEIAREIEEAKEPPNP